MTVKQLIDLLKGCEEGEEVMMYSDAEGNSVHRTESILWDNESVKGKSFTIIVPDHDVVEELMF